MYKIQRYNELTESWKKGIKWLSDSERTEDELERGLSRLMEILKEMSQLYVELKQAGVEVTPEKCIKE